MVRLRRCKGYGLIKQLLVAECAESKVIVEVVWVRREAGRGKGGLCTVLGLAFFVFLLAAC